MISWLVVNLCFHQTLFAWDWCIACMRLVHCLYETGALLAWDWCIACMRLVHCLHETGALLAWDWFIVCMRLVHCLHETGALLASDWCLVCLRLVPCLHQKCSHLIVCFLYFLVQQTDIWIDKWNWCLPAWRITSEQIWFRRGWVEPLWRSSWGRARPDCSRSVPSLGFSSNRCRIVSRISKWRLFCSISDKYFRPTSMLLAENELQTKSSK